VIPLPVTMHTGQIILLTKMLTKRDLNFYDFSTGAPCTLGKKSKCIMGLERSTALRTRLLSKLSISCLI
jgi:hypothetical protein